MRKFMLNQKAYPALRCAVLMMLAVALPGQADTLYPKGGTPPTFAFFSGNGLDGSGLTLGKSGAPTETAILADAILPLQIGTHGRGEAVKDDVESSSSGAPSDAKLDTLTTTGTITRSAQDSTTSCTACSRLLAGTTHDIAVDQTTGMDNVEWEFPNLLGIGTVPAGSSPRSTGLVGAPGIPVSAFVVDPSFVATPEPSSLLLLGVGLLVLAIFGRKKFAANGLAQS